MLGLSKVNFACEYRFIIEYVVVIRHDKKLIATEIFVISCKVVCATTFHIRPNQLNQLNAITCIQ